MKSIFLTGFSGFVGKNLISKFNGKYEIFKFERDSKININQNIVIHLAGIAHDTSNKLDSKIYYEINTELTIKVFDNFLKSNASDFIFLSSVKAARDSYDSKLDEDVIAKPKTHQHTRYYPLDDVHTSSFGNKGSGSFLDLGPYKYSSSGYFNVSAGELPRTSSHIWTSKKASDATFETVTHNNFTGKMLMYHSLQSSKYMSKWIQEKNRKNRL